MKMNTCTLLLLVVAVGSVCCLKTKCVKKKKYYGCFYKRATHQCLCKTRRACEFPFKFKSEKQCLDDVASQQGACKRHPCHKGICQPLKKSHEFLCKCSKTGFYGKRCHKPCPNVTLLSPEWLQKYLQLDHWQNTPLACIM